MPHTVPNRPTKGAVDPTVARKGSPDCRRCSWAFVSRFRLRSSRALNSEKRFLFRHGLGRRDLSHAAGEP